MVEELRRIGSPVSEERLLQWFPRLQIRAMFQQDSIRFHQDEHAQRLWEYDTKQRAEEDVLTAIHDGHCTLREIQQAVRRRFRVVRGILTSMERNGALLRSDEQGEAVWCSL